jgi:hypothetical protein
MFAASKTDGAVARADPFFDNVTTLVNTSGTNGLQNNTFIDSSTNNFTITRNGNTTQGSFSPFGEGWSNYFDGTGDYLVSPANAAFTFGSGDLTLECWIYQTATSTGSYRVIFADNVYGNLGGYTLYSYNNALNLWKGTSPAGGAEVIAPAGTISLNTWTHIAWTRSGSSNRLFINGTQVGATTADSTSYTGTVSYIGASQSGTLAFPGYISNARIVKGTAVYTANFTPSTVPLQPIAGTSLLTCKDSNIVDDSANQLPITRNGDVSVQKFSPFAGTTLPTPYYSGFFSGTAGNYLTFDGTSALAFGTGDFTVECWVWFFGLGSFNPIIDARTADTSSPWVFVIDDVGKISWFSTTGFSSTQSVVANSWNHVAVSRSGTTLRLFVNGLMTTATDSANYTALSTITKIGAYVNTASSRYRGYLSNLRVVKGTAVYTAPFTPSTVPLQPIANTTLLTLQSNTLVDNSTNNLTITSVGSDTRPITFAPFAVTYSSLQPYTPAVNGGSMYFDGGGDYLSNLNNNTALAMGAGDFTIEFWIYSTSASTQVIYENRNNTTTTAGGLQIFRNDSIIGIFDTGAGVTLASAPIAVNTWTHVAVVRSGSSTGNMKLYLNGSLAATSASANTTNYSLGYLIIGCYLLGGTPSTFFVGYISAFRLVKGTAVYTSNFVPQNAPFTAVTNTSLLLNATNAGIYDASTLNNFETAGTAQVSTGVKRYGISSVAFDGTGDYLVAPTSPNLDFGNGDFTIETWVNFNALASNRMLLDRWATGNAAGWQLYWRSTGTSMVFLIGAAVAVQDPNGSNITTGTWNYIAVTRSGTTLRLFVNGIVVATATNSASLTSTLPLAAGVQFSTLTNLLDAYLQDVRITKGVARYTANFAPPTAPLPTS